MKNNIFYLLIAATLTLCGGKHKQFALDNRLTIKTEHKPESKKALLLKGHTTITIEKITPELQKNSKDTSNDIYKKINEQAKVDFEATQEYLYTKKILPQIKKRIEQSLQNCCFFPSTEKYLQYKALYEATFSNPPAYKYFHKKLKEDYAETIIERACYNPTPNNYRNYKWMLHTIYPESFSLENFKQHLDQQRKEEKSAYLHSWNKEENPEKADLHYKKYCGFQKLYSHVCYELICKNKN